MSKLRIKVSGCMRSMTGAEVFCAIRSYLATAARHGIGALDALTQAAQGDPWIPSRPDKDNPARKPLPSARPELQSAADLSSYHRGMGAGPQERMGLDCSSRCGHMGSH